MIMDDRQLEPAGVQGNGDEQEMGHKPRQQSIDLFRLNFSGDANEQRTRKTHHVGKDVPSRSHLSVANLAREEHVQQGLERQPAEIEREAFDGRLGEDVQPGGC